MDRVEQLAKLLIRDKLTLSIAESCTAGMLSSLLTNIPGSSKFLYLSIIPYNNKFKTMLLNVPDKILNTKGAVSKETALLMAENVRKLAKTTLGLSITGIAGPTGATVIKPVGLVYIGLALPEKSIYKKFIFRGNRISIKKQAANAAIDLLLNQCNHIL